MTGRWLLAAVATVLAFLVLPAGAGTAAAHGGGLAPAASQPRIVAIEPQVAGLEVQVAAGARLRLVNTGPVDLVIDGAVLAPGAAVLRADARLAAAAGAGPPGRWSTGLAVDGRTVTVTGDTVWPSPPPAGLWWLAAGLAALATTALGHRAAHRRGARRAAGLVVLATVAAYAVHVVGAALVVGTGEVARTALESAGPVGFAAVGAGLAGGVLACAGIRSGVLLGAVSGALLVLLTGADVTGFWLAVLPFAWAADLDRLTTVLTTGAGVGLFLTGFAVLRVMTPEHTAP